MRVLPDQAAQLHTDLLGQLYPDIKVMIESQTYDIRKIHLVDKHGVSRTYAISFTNKQKWTKDIDEVWSQIKQGGAIGSSFRENGYRISKTTICVFPVTISVRIQRLFATDQPEALLHQYKFYVSCNKNDSWQEVATITEIYPIDVANQLQLHTTEKKVLLYADELRKDITI